MSWYKASVTESITLSFIIFYGSESHLVVAINILSKIINDKIVTNLEF